MLLKSFTDGGARGNPGPAGIGVVLRGTDDAIVERFGEYIGETTNNQAEYRAMIAALERAKELGATEVEAHADSELLVKQLHREYRVKNPDLAPLFVKIWNLAQGFSRCTFTHVRREQNKDADAMVNAAIDARGRVDG
ncbi:MAG: ribonuclease HI family protein [Candidatus Uhrbacteria bacterium]